MRALIVCLLLTLLGPAGRALAETPTQIDPPPGTEQAELDAAKALWAGQHLDEYVFTLRQACFCPTARTDPTLVFVKGGKALNARTTNERYSTVDKLFAAIQSVIDGGAEGLSVTYGEGGVPKAYSVDRPYVVDEEFGVNVSGFHPGPPTARERLQAARQAWRARNLESYDFRLAVGCFCPRNVTRPRTIKVREGKAVNATRFNRAYATVPKLFAQIDRALRNGVARLTVRYGKDGVPRSIFIDRDERIADEELSLSATRLRKP